MRYFSYLSRVGKSACREVGPYPTGQHLLDEGDDDEEEDDNDDDDEEDEDDDDDDGDAAAAVVKQQSRFLLLGDTKMRKYFCCYFPVDWSRRFCQNEITSIWPPNLLTSNQQFRHFRLFSSSSIFLNLFFHLTKLYCGM